MASDSNPSRFWQRIQGRLILLLLVLLIPPLVIQAYVYHERWESARAGELQANLEVARATAKAFETFVNDVLHQEAAIGLAICKKIVERHGGSITARSNPDRGATFIVILPATPSCADVKTRHG